MKSSDSDPQSDPKPWKRPFPDCGPQHKLEGSFQTRSQKQIGNAKVRTPYPCTFENCEYRAGNERNMRHHVKVNHTSGSRNFQCSTCSVQFCTKFDLKVHLRIHRAEKKVFKCDHCPYKSSHRGSFNYHVRAMHEGSTDFPCPFPECNYSTPWKSVLKVHQRKHESAPAARRPFQCKFPDCDYRASTQAIVDIHMARNHESNRLKEIMCPMCPKKFYDQHGMKLHIRAVHVKEKCHSCDECGFTALDACTIKLHRIAVHKEGPAREKKFKCELCDFRTYKAGPLRRHTMNVHSKERRFKCDYVACHYRTNHSAYLKIHMLIHEQGPQRQFPFGCKFPGCDFRRRTKCEMEKHEELHKKSEFMLCCKLCSNMYPDKGSLGFHEYITHSTTSFTCSVCVFTAPLKCVVVRHYRECHNPSRNQKVQVSSSNKRPANGDCTSAHKHIRITPLQNDLRCSGNSRCEESDEGRALFRDESVWLGFPVIVLNKIRLKWV